MMNEELLIRPAFCRHPEAIIHGNDRGVYEQQQAVHERLQRLLVEHCLVPSDEGPCG